MPGFQNHIGLNITSTRLQLVEINYSGEEFTLENIDEEYFSEILDMNAKETKIITLLQSAFNELVVRRPLKSKLVSFTLPHECFLSVRLPFENSVIQNDLLEHFKWELSLLYPKINVDDLIVQYVKIEDFEKTVSSNTALVIATFRKYLKILSSFCAQNGLKLKYIDNAHFASDNIIALKENCPSDEFVLSLYTGNNFLSTTVLFNNRAVYFNILPIKNAGEIVAKIKDELNNKFVKLSTENLAKVFIAGENLSDSLLDRIRENLNLNPEKVNPFEDISIQPELFANKFFTEKASSFTASAGIAFRLV